MADDEGRGGQAAQEPAQETDEAPALVNAEPDAPVNAAVALNVLSDGSVAYASPDEDGTLVEPS